MADTQRTLTDVLTLLADNNNKQISPQDHRDAVVSTFNNAGILFVDDGSTAQTTNATPNTEDKVTGFDTESADRGCVTPDLPNDQITVTTDGLYLVLWFASFDGSANTTYNGRIRWTGSAATLSGRWQRTIGSSAQTGCVACAAFFAITGGGSLYATIAATTASKSFTLVDSQFVVLKIG